MATYLFTTISALAKPRRTITAVALSSCPWELLPGNTVTGWRQNTITIIPLYAIITTIVVGKFSVWLMRRNNDRARSAHTTPGRLPTHIRTICVSLYLIAYLLTYQLPFIRAGTHARAKRDVWKRTRTWVFLHSSLSPKVFAICNYFELHSDFYNISRIPQILWNAHILRCARN